jgi:hypothetical protein
MKKTALALAVVAVLGIIGFGGPALAQNINNITNINTFDSTFFGFAPTAANINTFMQKDTVLSTGGDFTATAYVKNNQMPGAYTQRPDKVVNANPDFGCGAQVTSGSACVESVLNIEDRVNGNTTTANLAAATGGNGQNTAPTSQTPTGGGGPSGVLIGDLNSEVYLESVEDGMPSGSVVFSRTDGSDGTIDVNFAQTVSSTIAGFQTFTEHDYTLTPFVAIACPLATCTATNFPGTVAGQVGSRLSGMAAGFAHSDMGIRAELDFTQTSLGGEGASTEHVGYAVDWKGNGTYPTLGAYLTPGLNIAGGDWQGDPAVDTNGFPN